MSEHVLTVICTYNERENIVGIVEQVLSIVGERGVDILIVDDNSPDGTGEFADSLSRKYPTVHVIHGAKKRGLGRAYIEAFKWALKRNYDKIITMDADFSHDPKYLPQFLERSQECDLVIGSRYITGGGVRNWPWYRKLISRGGSLYARLVTGLPVSDATGGFNCFRRDLLESIRVETIHSEGYSYQIEVKHRAWKGGFRICEVPIVFVDRTSGKSKMSNKIFLEAIFACWRLRFSRHQ